MIRLFAALAATLALFLGVAAPAVAAPAKDVTYSAPAVPLVDDDGVTRNFFVVYTYKAATKTSPSSTRCTYAVQGQEVNNPEHPNYNQGPNPTSLLVGEGLYVDPSNPAPITNSADAIAYCVEKFPSRTHEPYPDPTI